MQLRALLEALRFRLAPIRTPNAAPSSPMNAVDIRLVNLLAVEIAQRADVPFVEALHLLSIVTAQGGPDIRTPRGWVHASIILNVPGRPLMPSLH